MAVVRMDRHIRSAAAVVVARPGQAEETAPGCGSGQPGSRHIWPFLFHDRSVTNNPGAV